MAFDLQQARTILALLDEAEGRADAFAKQSNASLARQQARRTAATPSAPRRKKGGGGGGFSFASPLMTALEVLDAPRAAVFSGAKELADVIRPQSGESASFRDLVEQTVDRKKRIYGSDVLYGSAEKGIGGVIDRESTPGWAQGASGFALDIAADPLTYLGGAGIVRQGAKTTAEAVARGGTRAVAKEATKRGFKEGGDKMLADFLREIDDDALNALQSRVHTATQQARRSPRRVSPEDLSEFTGGRAQRGLTFRVPFVGESVVPGTQSRAALKFGEGSARLSNALGDVLKGRGGKPSGLARALGGADAGLKAAARSAPDAERAFKAVFTLAQKGAKGARAKGLMAEYAREFTKLYRDLDDAERAVAMRALRGDPEAVARLGTKGQALRGFYDKIHEGLTSAGVKVNRIEDYAPNVLTPEAREFFGRYGGRGGFKQFFEHARTLKPGENVQFMGETFSASNNAELVDKVNDIFAKAARSNPDIAPEIDDVRALFFSDDLADVTGRYIRGASNRIALNEAAQRLADVGLGVASREGAEELTSLGKAYKPLLEAAQTRAQSGARGAADEAAEVERQIDEILAEVGESRKGQLFEDAAGNPLDRPLTDAQERAFASLAADKARSALGRARARLEASARADTARGVRRGRAATMLERKITASEERLRVLEELANNPAAASDVDIAAEIARVQTTIDNQTRSIGLWVERRRNVLDEAARGERTGVVSGEIGTESMGRIGDLDLGVVAHLEPEGWHVVQDAATIEAVAQEHAAAMAHLSEMRDTVATFLNYKTTLGQPNDRGQTLEVLRQMAQDLNLNPTRATDPREILSGREQWARSLVDDPRERAAVVRRIEKNLREAIKETDEIVEVAAKSRNLAFEDSVLRQDYGVPVAPLYHGTSNAFPGDVARNRTGGTFENLHGPGFYTTDNGREILVGERAGFSPGEGYVSKGLDDKVDELQGNPTAYGYEPADPDAFMLDLDEVGVESLLDDAPEELSAALDEWAGGNFAAAYDEWANTPFGAEYTHPPTLQFFADDMDNFARAWADAHPDSEFAQRLARGYAPDYAGDGDSLEDIYGAWRAHVDSFHEYEVVSQSPVLGTGVQYLDDADADGLLRDYVEHLYDDFGVKGLTHRGGQITNSPIDHRVSIWFRPESDLTLVGKTDFTKALADVRITEFEHMRSTARARLSELTDEMAQAATRRADDLGAVETSARELKRLRAARKKYGKTPSAVRRSRATEAAETAAQDALDQQDIAETFLADTVEAAAERQMTALEKARRIDNALRGWGDSAPRTLREAASEYTDALRQGARWGKVQQQAVAAGDEQLARVASLEQAAHAARAEATDLGEQALTAERGLANLPTERVEKMAQTFRDGAYREIKAGVGTPQEVADWLLHVDRLTTPEGMRGALKVFDRAVGWLKDYQIMTPGFHIRNSLGGIWNNSLAGVDTNSYRKFYSLMKRARGAAKGKALSADDQQVWDAVIRATGRGQIGSEFSNVNLLEELGGRGKGSILPTRRFYGVQASKRAGEATEFRLRGVLAYDQITKGLRAGDTIDDAIEAANSAVAKYHFNYDDLSATEQGIKKVIPFYTWTRRNVPLQAEQIVKSPRIYARYEQARSEIESLSEEDPIVPSWFRDNLAIRLPWMAGGGHRYAMIDLPLRDLNRITQPDDILSMTTPVIKTPIELKFGKQVFKDLPLRDDRFAPLHPALDAVPGLRQALDVAGVGASRGGEYFLSEREMYALEQGLPLLGRMRRLAPNESKYQNRALTSWLSFIGLGSRTNTAQEQDIARWFEEEKPKGDAARRESALQRALDEMEQ